MEGFVYNDAVRAVPLARARVNLGGAALHDKGLFALASLPGRLKLGCFPAMQGTRPAADPPYPIPAPTLLISSSHSVPATSDVWPGRYWLPTNKEDVYRSL